MKYRCFNVAHVLVFFSLLTMETSNFDTLTTKVPPLNISCEYY